MSLFRRKLEAQESKDRGTSVSPPSRNTWRIESRMTITQTRGIMAFVQHMGEKGTDRGEARRFEQHESKYNTMSDDWIRPAHDKA